MALVTRQGIRARSVRWLALLLAWTIVSGLPAVHVAVAALTEDEAKVGALYHFGWYVEWPATAVQGRDPAFIIGVFGADPFGGRLDDIMKSKTIREHPVVIRRYQRIEDARSSHILFISASEEQRLPSILEGLAGASVLTVSNLERFTERGGMIALRVVDRKVHFDINVEATKRVGLKMGSQLLKLARAVHGTPQRGQ